jgi:hypothetical protein
VIAMIEELRAADERFEVVRVAEAWRGAGAGAIDDAALAAIRSRFADDRKRTKAAFRVLFFLFTFWGGLAVWGFFASFVQLPLFRSGDATPHAVLLGFLAVAFGFGAWYAIERMRLRRFGIEEGLLLLALGFELGACGLFLDEAGVPERWIGVLLGSNLAIVSVILAGRWGIAATGALAGAGFFGALALLPSPRTLWIVLSLPLIFFARWVDRQDTAAAAHRRRARELGLISVLALYLAVHVSVWQLNPIDEIFGRGSWSQSGAPEGTWLTLGWLAMFALPLFLIVSGVKRRDRLELSLGALGLIASSISAIDALDLEPPWLILTVAGILLLAIALGLRRLFASNSGRVVAGFTDAALYEPDGGRSFLELAGTLAALTPAARPLEHEPAFRGRGGDFGGGGATKEF